MPSRELVEGANQSVTTVNSSGSTIREVVVANPVFHTVIRESSGLSWTDNVGGTAEAKPVFRPFS